MIFTSYFAKIKDLPPNVIPVAICAKVPDWYKGLRCPKLAPKYDALIKYKVDHNEADYAECFNDTTLKYLDPVKISKGLLAMVDVFCERDNNSDYHIALICYEAPDKFCHRHLVAQWFKNHGIECKEWDE